jgi:chemotaxis signal transduction protein
MTSPNALGRAAALREAFDDVFSRAPMVATEATEDFLLVHVGSVPHALRLSEFAGVAKDRPFVPAPSRRPELLGLAAMRGTVVCVYSMARLLGLPDQGVWGPWLALSTGRDPVAWAFGHVERFLRADRTDVHPGRPAEATRLVNGILRLGSTARPIVDLPSMLEAVQRRAEDGGPLVRSP